MVFDEQPVVRCIAADMAFTAGQTILDPLPLRRLAIQSAARGRPLRKADLASITRQLDLGIPNVPAALQNRTAFRVRFRSRSRAKPALTEDRP